jgi:5-methyltetrahydrofolate--homocysteine methyltransferase
VRLLSLAQARANAPKLRAAPAPAPRRPGRHVVTASVADLRPYIDWTPFFIAWELPGTYPGILLDTRVGDQARALYADAQRLLDTVQRDGSLIARGVAGVFAARRDGDDIALAGGEVLHTLRQQREQRTAQPEVMQPNVALSDFVADAGDHVGAFAVAIHGAEELAAEFEAQHDDYSAILVKAVADRLAEAFAEKLHADVRRDLWGYAPDEQLTTEDLVRERYRGIRPAPGYPAQPDHTEKRTLFRLLGAHEAGLALTESGAMSPAASVSGLYLGGPRRARSGGGLRPPQGLDPAGGRAVARADPRVRA